MDSENRSKRDLPEVVADILITLEQVQQQQAQMQQDMNEGLARLNNSFDRMTEAVIDAMNRQTARYDGVATQQTQQHTDIESLQQRIERLEKTVYNKAS
ncbi:hypothetical protein [Hymenobacter profundi]|uniref:t-SNARE coiled-coil homology domain-containing protein n=1 Tax=Hymenobacter profundi TaxID=1982110 RepID=A0ABS6X226_9BACT|nr:hypothetical protein [Hymenobacter profundi]MBW3129891.1 hypothetical protein [Hymenobacter profundi]